MGGYGAGIGGSNKAAGETITISGGTVIATGGEYGAGIGGGNEAAGKTITISEGNVTATGGEHGAGIGGGDGDKSTDNSIKLTGGNVTAIGNRGVNDHDGAFGNATVSFGASSTWYQYQTSTKIESPVSDSIYTYSSITPIDASATTTRKNFNGIHIVANANASISPTTATYNTVTKPEVSTTIDHTLGSIKNGDYTLQAGTDYSVSGKKVTISSSYLNRLSTGKTTLTFDYGNVSTKPTLEINVVVSPTITTTTLPNGFIGDAYSQTLAATGDATITWSLASGSLPYGLSLSASGVISGKPTTADTFSFTVKATNGINPDATKELTIKVLPKISVSPDSLDFGTITYGDTRPAAKQITVTNHTALEITGIVIAGVQDSKFTYGAGIESIPGVGFVTFDVQPNDKLDAGTYTDTINIQYDNQTYGPVTVTFTVNKAEQKKPTGITVTDTGLSGVTTDMEYTTDPNGTWTGCTTDMKLDSGTYYVRYKETANKKPGSNETFTITRKVIKGAGQTGVKPFTTGMEFTCNGPFSKNNGVQIDGQTVSNPNIKEGSTILTLSASYLNSLSAGTHTLKFLYTDGQSVSTTFTVNAAPDTPSSSNTTVSEQDKTFLVTFLDARGNTVKVEWVKYGGSATAPTGYGTYSGYWNVTANMDLRPSTTTKPSSGYIVPNTADKN